jgi:hypothetical protein
MEFAHIFLPIALMVFFIGLFAYALFQTGKAIYHFHKAIENITDKYAPLKTGLIFFTPSSFNQEGQMHLIKTKQHLRKLLYSVAPVIIFIVVTELIRECAN